MPLPISPPPLRKYALDCPPAYLSNGVIGLRVSKIPPLDGYASLNGYVGRHPGAGVESNVQAPYPLGVDLRIGGYAGPWLSRSRERASFIEQRYDFSCGELHSRWSYQVENATATIDVLTFCSRSLPMLALQEVQIHVDEPCTLDVRAQLDPVGIPGTVLRRDTRSFSGKHRETDGTMLWESPGGLARCGIAYRAFFSGDDAVRESRDEQSDAGLLFTNFRFQALPGQCYSMQQIAAMVPSVMHHDPDQQAIRLLFRGEERGFETLRSENRACWEELWQGRVHLLGASERWQAIADAAYFYLHTSIHPSSPCSTGLFGLAHWHNYHYFLGHVFWDIETFAFPPTLLTAPASARAMLDYRSRHLQAAHYNAMMNGYDGIQFPWQSSPLHGEEATPNGAGPMINEHHINMDVAFAFAQYVHATGDEIFARQQAWPVLSGVADWICSRVVRTDRGYELHQVIGIMETGTPVDNCAYVNMTAVVILREAITLARRLSYTPPSRWRQVAEHMVLLINEQQIILNHEQFVADDQSYGPEALAGFFPFPYEVPPEVEQATIRYYLSRVEGYIGYPMMSSLLGVYAARLGDRALSAELFERGYANYVHEPFWDTDEYGKNAPPKPRVGPYLANLGGFLSSCIYGLPGIQLRSGLPQNWCRRPVVMPQDWEGILVERIWVHGQPARLVALHGAERAEITLEAE